MATVPTEDVAEPVGFVVDTTAATDEDAGAVTVDDEETDAEPVSLIPVLVRLVSSGPAVAVAEPERECVVVRERDVVPPVLLVELSSSSLSSPPPLSIQQVMRYGVSSTHVSA